MKDRYSSNRRDEQPRVPEARYSYYRRCQVFRRNGEQCKAPAEKGEAICHAHAAQQAMAFRRDLERRIVLAEAVAQMRRQGRPECELADLLSDFKGIQVTLAVVARALIGGRIDYKTAGRLLVHLQTMSKLLRMVDRKTSTTEARRHLPHQAKTGLAGDPGGEQQGLPQICADERRLNRGHELPVLPTPQAATPSMIERVIYDEAPQASDARVRAIPDKPRSLQNGKWEQPRAA
ncbi:MAG: hypothetical protein WCE73_02450 [Candidatus Angelobacter sp.]